MNINMYGALAEKLGIGLQNLVDGGGTRTHLHVIVEDEHQT